MVRKKKIEVEEKLERKKIDKRDIAKDVCKCGCEESLHIPECHGLLCGCKKFRPFKEKTQ